MTRSQEEKQKTKGEEEARAVASKDQAGKAGEKAKKGEKQKVCSG
jgi:hypothetical protein